MVVINRTCTTCNNEFELHFRYQMEEHTEQDAQGVARTHYTFYCSQRCLEASHRGRTDGSVACDACATRFEVELASHVLFTGGRRHYACGPECRARILAGVRSVRLGQLLDPSYPIENDSQGSEEEPAMPSGPSELALAVAAEAEPSNDASATPPAVMTSVATDALPAPTPAPPMATV